MNTLFGRRRRHWNAVLLYGTVFSAVAVSACLFIADRSCRVFDVVNTDELENIARLAATQIDPVQHQRINSADQYGTPSYTQQVLRLKSVLDNVRNVKFIYTVRAGPQGMVFILDPTEPGDTNADGLDDKSYPMDSVENVTPGMLDVFRTGIAQVDQKPYSDKWGTWISAYAPIKSKDGKTVALVGVDRDYRIVQEHQRQVWQLAALASAMSVIMAFACVIAFATTQAPKHNSEVSTSKRRIRRRVVETLLMLAVASLVVEGTLAAGRYDAIRSQRDRLLGELSTLEATGGLIDTLEFEPVPFADPQLLRNLRELNLSTYAYLSNDLTHLIGNWSESGATYRNQLSHLRSSVRSATTEVQRRLSILQPQERETNQREVVLLILALSLAVASTVMIQVTSRNDEKLLEAHSEQARAQQDHEQLVKSLPISLFAVSGDGVVFKNIAWQNLVGAKDQEPSLQTFLDCVPTEDQEAVHAALRAAPMSQEDQFVEHRLQSPTQGTVWLQSRFKAILGPHRDFRYVLVFSIDVTADKAAQSTLQARNQEILTKNQRLAKSLEELEDALEQFVRAMVRAIEAKDPYTAGHSERVMEFSLMIGHEMALGPYEMRILQIGTLVHDLGKIGVPDNVLTKPGKLTNEEFEAIKKHPEFGANIMGDLQWLQDCLPIVRSHHERLDGSGYPDKLQGDEIPLLVRIAAVADVFDALTSTRSYRGSIETEEVFRMLWDEVSAGKLDGTIVQHLQRALRKRKMLDEIEPDLEQAA